MFRVVPGAVNPKAFLDISGAFWPLVYTINKKLGTGFVIEEAVRDDYLEAFSSEVKSTDCKTVIFSCEDLYYYSEEFIDYLLNLFPFTSFSFHFSTVSPSIDFIVMLHYRI